MTPVRKYLARWAEPEGGFAEAIPGGPWSAAVIVPARAESAEDCLASVAALPADVLLILVINGAADDEAGRLRNLDTLAALGVGESDRVRGWALRERDGSPVLILDRASADRTLPAKRGVGLARKIGSDLALALWRAGRLRSRWLHWTDADARLPADLLARAEAVSRPRAAISWPFWHAAGNDPEIDEATARYELGLRYYVTGLDHAGSPWAFHTIGSAISIDARSYAAVRGVPRRAGGEDFYMLAKLAKLGAVHRPGGAPVRVRSRRSTRAPFGTGPAVERLLAGEDWRVYDPRCFEVLGEWQARLAALARGGEPGEPSAALREIGEALELFTRVDELRRRYPGPQLAGQLDNRFDAFSNLRLIHAATRRWPKLDWAQACAAARFLPDELHARPLDEQRRHLLALEPRDGP